MQHTIERAGLGTVGPVLAATLAFARRAFRAYRHRREVEMLLTANDHMLADIGLSRADVVGALQVPMGDDPSLELIRARQERRRARIRTK
ncbi:DUF1127 domain-containing protein [Lutibaculum baratangense]|uniref:YjiS-like domain-containing protein n=1 Tax=Lutibaculum baratangense AMV1 TaxID=631454 RepID=V4RP41_9HYPH|nr:DUF1127 domain-containing protein [Lutibaculum baratangense]ESR24945.1 hypothetical protein N177_2268 [Lutibaculum baratangense AMV1]